MTTPLTPEELFLDHLPHIERVAAHLCRRNGFSREHIQDFISIVQLKMIEDEYGVFRKFSQKSRLKTYLTVVVSNFFKDHLDHLWGKWRPSAEAVRLGGAAIQLEKLHRDGFTFAEACKIILTNHHLEVTHQELWDLWARLRPRNPPRRMERAEVLEDHPAEDLSPDERIEALERRTRLEEILEMMKEILARLPAEDALLAKMSCELKISEIARRLHLEQKPLYRRLEKILKEIRQELERRGVRPEEIGDLLIITEDEDEPLG